MNSIKSAILLSCIFLTLVSCDHFDAIGGDDYATLTLHLSTISTASRSNVTEFPDSPDKWTQAEKAVDGRYLYNVSVYIIDSNKNIVASQESINIDGQASDTTITFDKSYNLKRGIYTLMAVANNCNHIIDGITYSNSCNDTWDSSSYDGLMNNTIIANTTHNVAPFNEIRPLSLMKEIELHAGNNNIVGELVRTFARIRINVKNNSGNLPLRIHDLTFSDNFTQQQAYVFDDGTNRKYFGTTGSPNVSTELALQSFVTNEATGYKTINAQESAVLFDSYLLESQAPAGENYSYTIDLSYEGATTTTYSYSADWDTQINQVNNLSVSDESYFLLYNNNYSRFLSGGSENVETSTLSQNSSTIATNNVWQLIKNGSYFYIKNVESGLYMQAPTNNSISLGATPVAFSLTTKTVQRGWGNNATYTYYITLQANSGYYINMNRNNTGDRWNPSYTYNVQGSSGNNSNGTYFVIYNVNKNATSSGNENISYNAPITLTTIDPVTQQSNPTTEIRRNDFIDILITVSYNPNAGTLEFFVEDWNEKSSSIEFN